jgi:hypothetical protein
MIFMKKIIKILLIKNIEYDNDKCYRLDYWKIIFVYI